MLSTAKSACKGVLSEVNRCLMY